MTQASKTSSAEGDSEKTRKDLLKGIVQVSESSFLLETRMERANGTLSEQTTSVETVAAEAAENAKSMAALSLRTSELTNEAQMAQMAVASGTEGLSALSSVLDDLDRQQEKTFDFFSSLSKEVETMASLLNSIGDISDGLKVIAVNASIVAARAGEAGRPFAVLAKEVQSVAGRTTDASDRASRILSNLHGQIQGLSAGLVATRGLASTGKTRGEEALVSLESSKKKNEILEQEIVNLAVTLLNQETFAKGMESAARDLLSSNGRVGADVSEATHLAAALHEVVEGMLIHAGGFRVSWHENLERDLSALVSEREGNQESWETFLKTRVKNFPAFSLLYVMGPSGRQIAPNVVAERYEGVIEGGQEGVDRRNKPYFLGAKEAGKPYISEIYVSTASRSLCLTVSLKLPTGEVLAADVSLNDLVREEKSASVRPL